MTATTKTLAAGEAVTVRNGAGTSAPTSVTLAPGDTYAITAASATVTPPPPPPPPSGTWFAYPGTIPAGAKTYTGSGSLGAFLSGLAAGAVGVLDFDTTVTENISVTLKDGVTILPGPGRRPWLRGDLHLSCGKLATLYGLSIRYDNAPPDDHVLDVKSGSIDFGYGEVAYANCYTLIHPADTIHDWRFHHLWVHDNLGVGSHDGNQDHGFYCSAASATQNGRIDHCLIENMPRGRNVKIGTSGSGGTPGGIVVDHVTMRLGHGPSNAQVSNGATQDHFTNCVLIDSNDVTNLTAKSSPGTGSTYGGNWSDKTTGPNNSYLKDTGGNIVKARATLLDYVANGLAGKGHLAP